MSNLTGRTILAVLATCLAVSACSEPEPSEFSKEYPEGPYGLAVGDTLPNVRAVASDGVELRASGVYQGGPDALLIYVSASWCFTCRAEIKWIDELPEYQSGRLAVWGILLQNGAFEPPSTDDLAAFVTEYGPSFPFALDDDEYFESVTTDVIPQNFVINTDTMRVTYRDAGFHTTALQEEIDAIP